MQGPALALLLKAAEQSGGRGVCRKLMNGQTILPPAVCIPRDKVFPSKILLTLTSFYNFPRTGINNGLILFDNELRLTRCELRHRAIVFTIGSFQVNLPLVMPPVQMSTCLTVSASLLQH